MPSCWPRSCCGSDCRDKPTTPLISPPLHLLLKPPDAGILGHTFRSKVFKKARPCNLCHQPIRKQGSSCRVCKYACHKACEPKVWRACQHPRICGQTDAAAGPDGDWRPLSRGDDGVYRSFADLAPRIYRECHQKRWPFPSLLAYYQHTQKGHCCTSTKQQPMLLNNHHEGLARNQKAHQVLSSSSPRSRSVSGSTPSSHPAAMDLNFVTERIMFLSFPADIPPAQYRAELRKAAAMLQTKHGHNYMVFNLSAPRRDVNKLNPHVLDMGWVEGLAPPLERLCSICKSIDSWLQADPQHTAVLHSRGGMERIGVVVAAYMHYTTICASDDQALDRYAMQRFFDERIGFLQRPSDKRYVEYFAGLLSGSIQINGSPLYLDHVTVLGVPGFESRGGCKAFVKVYQGSVPLYTSAVYHVPETARHLTISLEKGLQLRGDILVKCYHRKAKPPARETVFSCQFHTCAVAEQMLVFNREALDHACHDLRFPFDGMVQLHFSTGPDTRRPVPLPQSAGVTLERSHDDPVTRWDSYETFDTGQEEDDILEDEAGTGEENELVPHTPGPVDGSLYATVAKRSNKSPVSSSSSPLLTTVTHKNVHSVLRKPADHDQPLRSAASPLRNQHIRFLNSPHVASIDSGISSAGAGLRDREREREAHLSGSSVSPPHSGSHSAESAVAFSDPDPTSPTPSPISLSAKMPISVAPGLHRAEVHPTPATNGGVALKQETSELDQLLTGMLLNVQNIPDIRPSQRLIKEIDVDSIQVHFPQLPDKSTATYPGSPSPIYGNQPNRSPSNGNTYTYESSTVLRSAMGKGSAANPPDLARSATPLQNRKGMSGHDVIDGTNGMGDKDIPYHARQNSQPFTYGMLTNGSNPSPSLHRRNSKESLNLSKPGLASPSLVRKFSGGNLNLSNAANATANPPPLPNLSPTDEVATPLTFTPRSTRKLSYEENPIATSSPRSANNLAPAPVPVRSPMHSAKQIQESNVFASQAVDSSTTTITKSNASATLNSSRNGNGLGFADETAESTSVTLGRSSERTPRPSQSSQSNSTWEETSQDVTVISDTSSSNETGLTWLQRQQQKLRERKDSFRRAERSPNESRLMTELRAVQQQYGMEGKKTIQTRPDDGYLSDTTLLSDWATSREGSPETGSSGRQIYSTPLHINTSGYAYQGSKNVLNGKNGVSSGNNSATIGANRSTSLERSQHYNSLSSAQDTQLSKTALSRQKSDVSHDRERPFMAVKRAHDQRKNSDRSPQALLQASSPLGYTHDSLGLLTTVEGNNGTVSKIDALLATLAEHNLTPNPSAATNTNHVAAVPALGISATTNRITFERQEPRQDQVDFIQYSYVSHPPAHEEELGPDDVFYSTLEKAQVPELNNNVHGLPPTTPVSRYPLRSATNSNRKDDSLLSWSSSNEERGGAITPAFPVPPRTPYVNHMHHELTISPSGAGLPPKSPTAQRRTSGGVVPTTPGAGFPHTGSSVSSPAAHNVKSVRKWPSNTSVSSKDRSPSPAHQWNTLEGTLYPPSSPSLYTAQSRRSSVGSLGGELHDVSPVHVNFVKDTSRFWYKPGLAREDTINLLKDRAPGTFIIRNSNSFPGAFGLAVKVATPPTHVASKGGDLAAELVRHFLIEPTSRGVRLKGCTNEPVFGSLSALVYQHSVTPLALPCKLVLPDTEASDTVASGSVSPAIQLLGQGAACNVLYLFTMDTESLTGLEAVQRTMSTLLATKPLPVPTVVHFKVSSQGITLTDSERKLFFRRHYPVNAISFCGHDADDRRWNQKNAEGVSVSSNRCFGFVARKPASKTDNQCHVFAELEPEQPASAIVNFVTKVMMTGPNSKLNIV